LILYRLSRRLELIKIKQAAHWQHPDHEGLGHEQLEMEVLAVALGAAAGAAGGGEAFLKGLGVGGWEFGV